MCRLLAVKSKSYFSINSYLQRFSDICKESREYQGDGWGCTYLKNGKWKIYKDVRPIWQDDFPIFGTTKMLMVHARSAFDGTKIEVENNMPFENEDDVFIFNGELRNVRIKEEGKIGAEKIFNYIRRFNPLGKFEALKKGTELIEKRTGFVRAMNIILSDKKNLFVSSLFCKDPEYFTMWKLETNLNTVVCSVPLTGENGWKPIKNKTVLQF